MDDRQDACAILAGIEPADVQALADRLNRLGWASDEDGLCLSSTLVERWTTECTALLRGQGYAGSDLMGIAQYFSHCGAIYVLYDSERLSVQDALAATEQVARRTPG